MRGETAKFYTTTEWESGKRRTLLPHVDSQNIAMADGHVQSYQKSQLYVIAGITTGTTAEKDAKTAEVMEFEF